MFLPERVSPAGDTSGDRLRRAQKTTPGVSFTATRAPLRGFTGCSPPEGVRFEKGSNGIQHSPLFIMRCSLDGFTRASDSRGGGGGGRNPGIDNDLEGIAEGDDEGAVAELEVRGQTSGHEPTLVATSTVPNTTTMGKAIGVTLMRHGLRREADRRRQDTQPRR